MRVQSGFTLLEVLIAVLILAFLSVFTVESIRNALRSKVRIQRDIDRFAELRDALRIMERDINMAFNYRDFNEEVSYKAKKELFDFYQKECSQAPPPETPGAPPPPKKEICTKLASNPPQEPTKKEEKILTQFIGAKDSLNFSTRNYVRVTQDEQASDQMEVGYSLKSCKSRANVEQSSNCLWRRTSKYIDDKIDEGGKEVAILEHVKVFEMRYLGPGKDGEWSSAWSSGEGGDDVTRKHFPYAVEVTIEAHNEGDPTSKPTRMTMVAGVRNPNNPPKKNPEGEPTGGSGDGGGNTD